IGAAPDEANAFGLEAPPAAFHPPAVEAGGDLAARQQHAVGIRDPAPGRDLADDPRAAPAQGDPRDVAVGGPLAAGDEPAHGGHPVGLQSGSTQTLPAVSWLRVRSRPEARRRRLRPTGSTSVTASAVPGTRLRSCRYWSSEGASRSATSEIRVTVARPVPSRESLTSPGTGS